MLHNVNCGDKGSASPNTVSSDPPKKLTFVLLMVKVRMTNNDFRQFSANRDYDFVR